MVALRTTYSNRQLRFLHVQLHLHLLCLHLKNLDTDAGADRYTNRGRYTDRSCQ